MARLCPHCGNRSSFNDIPVNGKYQDKIGFHYLERCQECGGIVYSISNIDKNAPVSRGIITSSVSESEETKEIEIFSYPFISMEPPIKISDSFYKSFTEGVKCLNVSAPFAAVTMFRKCLQIIVEDKGGAGRDLKEKIQSLCGASGILTGTLETFSTVIREIGNDGAHSNPYEPSIDDAKDILKFLLLLLDYLYIFPEKAEELRKRRESVKI